MKISGNRKKKPKKKVPERREAIKLDQIVKLLFNVSNPLVTHAINGLFNEKFSPDDIDLKISKTATEFPKNNLDMLRADMFVKFEKLTQKRHFHMEYQLSADSGNIVIRVFEYGIQKAVEVRRNENDNKGKLILPRAVVIHFEEDENIPDKYVLEVEFPNGTVAEYTADVMKYWKFNDAQLIDKKLYILLPLQLFLLRAKLESATKANDEQERQKTIIEAMESTEKLRDIVTELYEENIFDINDYDKMMIGLSEIFRHLNDRYEVKPELNVEVEDMVKTFIDKNLIRQTSRETEKQTKIEMAKKMLLNGELIDNIVKYTELTERQIKSIQKQLNN